MIEQSPLTLLGRPLELETKPETCKGVVFKGHVSIWWTPRGLAQKTELRLMKRMSCKGCEKCGFWDECLSEYAGEDRLDLGRIEHGKFYSPTITNVSTDWETGLTDDFDIDFVEVQDGA